MKMTWRIMMVTLGLVIGLSWGNGEVGAQGGAWCLDMRPEKSEGNEAGAECNEIPLGEDWSDECSRTFKTEAECLASLEAATGAADFGEIKPFGEDAGVEDLQTGPGGLDPVLELVNNIILFSVTIAAIWLIITIILQGIKVINSKGDPKKLSEAVKKIIWSLAGLALVALAYVLAGWMSQLIFGDEGEILQPEITAPRVNGGDEVEEWEGGQTGVFY